jgi:hypothetical protein
MADLTLDIDQARGPLDAAKTSGHTIAHDMTTDTFRVMGFPDMFQGLPGMGMPRPLPTLDNRLVTFPAAGDPYIRTIV